MVEENAPWRKVAKDHPWSRQTDPSSLTGDEWVGKGDPGEDKATKAEDVEKNPHHAVVERFMHPQHDVEY